MANFLKSLFVKGVEIDTAGAVTGDVLKYNGSKFGAASAGGSTVGALDDLSDVVITSPTNYQLLTYNGTNWVNDEPTVTTYVRNGETTTLNVGEVVYLNGQQGDRATVKRAINTGDSTSAKTLGIVGASIAANADGPVVTQGYAYNLNLGSYTAGQTLYLGSTAGTMTATKPYAPNHLVYVGVVVRANNGNGILYVRTQNGYELDEIHDVDLTTTPPTSGQYLKFGGTVWTADTIDLGTDTNGSYVASLVAGTGISLANNTGEGATPTITNTGVTSINTTLTGAVTGVVTTSDTGTVTSTMISDGTIVNADINASAAIAISKLASGTSGQVIIGNGIGVPTYTTLSGDVTVDSAGVTTISANSVALGTDTTGNYMSGISGTSPVSVSHTPAEGSSATVSLASGYGDTQNPYASKTANYVLAAPNGTAGTPSFRAIVAADIPTLNQNTTGTAASVTDAAQTAITSVGTLSSLVVSGDLTVDTSTLKVDSTNNYVGIGKSSPSAKLDIATTSSESMSALVITNEGTGYTLFVQDSALDATPFVIDSSGNVGIGKPVPTSTLDVVGTTVLTGSATITGDVTIDTNTFKVDSTNNRVGIGTTSPSYELHVVGSALVSSNLFVQNNATFDAGTLYVDATNNRVGVLTTSPASGYQLDVEGAVRATNYYVGSNTTTKSMPRGVIAYGTNTTADAAVGITEKTVINTSSFTPVTGRIYRITAYEPQIASPATAGAYAVGRLRLSSLIGTQLVNSIIQNAPATGVNFTMVTSWVGTLTAASTTIYYTIQASVASFNAQRSSTAPAYLIVEDLGTT